MSLRRLAIAFVLALAGCGGDSPSEPEPELAAFEHSSPRVVQAGSTVELAFGVRALQAVGSWERGGLTVSLPGVFDPQGLEVLEVVGDEVRHIPPSPHGGGFDVIVVRHGFAAGDLIRVRVSVRVRPDATSGTHQFQMDAVAYNEVADQRVLELGIVRMPVTVQAR